MRKPPVPKSEARRIVLSRANEFTSIESSVKSKKILEKLSQTDDFVYSKKIFTYISHHPWEPDTRSIINLADGRGKSIFIPKLHRASRSFRRFQFTGWNELIKNEKGYLEPKIGIADDMSDIDLIIVPAVAVSLIGQRAGRGGGFYDKLLRNTFAPKFVLAFEFQLFSEIETEHHDVRIDKIITERRIINTRNK